MQHHDESRCRCYRGNILKNPTLIKYIVIDAKQGLVIFLVMKASRGCSCRRLRVGDGFRILGFCTIHGESG